VQKYRYFCALGRAREFRDNDAGHIAMEVFGWAEISAVRRGVPNRVLRNAKQAKRVFALDSSAKTIRNVKERPENSDS